MERDEAIRYLTHDESGEDTGGLYVPCSRWGRNGADCAEVAYDLAMVYADASGEPYAYGDYGAPTESDVDITLTDS